MSSINVKNDHNKLRHRGLQRCHLQDARFQSGFTLTEMMAVVVLIAVLMAIAFPGWIRFVDTQRLNSAQAVVYQGIRDAQAEAQQHRSEWQFSVRAIGNDVEWTTHAAIIQTEDADNWQSVGNPVVQLDAETTLQVSGNGRTVRFDHKGNVVSRLGRVTLSSKRLNKIKRCVYVSTIIGALRQSKEKENPYDGDFCY